MSAATRLVAAALRRNSSIDAVTPITTMALTNSRPLRRWTTPPFLTARATAPRSMASPPAAMWIGKSPGIVGFLGGRPEKLARGRRLCGGAVHSDQAGVLRVELQI